MQWRLCLRAVSLGANEPCGAVHRRDEHTGQLCGRTYVRLRLSTSSCSLTVKTACVSIVARSVVAVVDSEREALGGDARSWSCWSLTRSCCLRAA